MGANIHLELGVTYTIFYCDGSSLTFVFVGGNPPMVLVDGKVVPLSTILNKPHISIKKQNK